MSFTLASTNGMVVLATSVLFLALAPAASATVPTVTIEQAVGQSDPTLSTPIDFTVVFSEAVNGFETGDVTLTGTAGATTGAVTGNGTTYNVAVSGMTRVGTVIATIAAGVAKDSATNKDDNAMSTSKDNSVTFGVSIAELIGRAKPMTAVLFSSQARNSFEVVKDPNPDSATPTIGIINQNQAGSTAGILVAAEAPFALADILHRRVPIGAWFGVNLQTGGGEEVSDVSLAAGLSFGFLSKHRLESLEEGGGPGLAGSARLLLGVIYGEIASLGPKNSTEALKVGDRFILADSLPLNKRKQAEFAIGIGFRF